MPSTNDLTNIRKIFDTIGNKAALLTTKVTPEFEEFLKNHFNITKTGRCRGDESPATVDELKELLHGKDLLISQLEKITPELAKTAKTLKIIICMRGG